MSQSQQTVDKASPVPADGDGMLHACRITPDGTVSYANHLIQTNRLVLERAAKHQMVMRVSSQTWSVGCHGLYGLSARASGCRLCCAEPFCSSVDANHCMMQCSCRLLRACLGHAGM